MKMFRAMFGDIEEVEITKKTDSNVFLDGRHEKLIGSYWGWFDTFQEAKDHLIKRIEEKIFVTENQIKYLQHEKSKIEKLC
jgi:hypothetical protein